MTKQLNRFRMAMAVVAAMIALVAIASFGNGYRFGNDLARQQTTH